MILDEICAHKREELAHRKRCVPLDHLKEQIERARRPRDFREALRMSGISLIAEIKRASPVKGVLQNEMAPADLARMYEQGGARAISVLTDERYFQGSLEDLIAVHQATVLPCLRKEFIMEEYQVYESRAAEADAILLIVRILSNEQLADYIRLADELGMACLVETHTAEEIERALHAGADIIGINNRDLSTFETRLATTLELRRHVPDGHALVSESGIQTRDHVRMLEEAGVDAILVGEALLTSKSIVEKIRELLGK